MEQKIYSLSLSLRELDLPRRLSGLILIYLMLFFSDFSFTQVRIKEKVVINPQNQPIGFTNLSTSTSSTTPTIITATLQYRACSGNVTLYVSESPCNSYNHFDAIGAKATGCGEPKTVQLTIKAYDPGSYSFSCSTSLVCEISCCGYLSNCTWSFTISDNKGWSNTISGIINPVGGSYHNSTSNVCSDVEPQTVDTTSFEVYKQGDLFIDTRLPQPIVVDNCAHDLKLGTIRFGLTIPLRYVNMNKVAPYYNALQDVRDINKDPVICLDNTNPADLRWFFQFKTKVRIPIFSSLCNPPGYRNLGGDSTFWQTTISSCGMYEIAEESMLYWKDGNYASKKSPPNKFYFDSMIMAHEETHMEDLKKAIQDSMNKAYLDAFTNRPHTSLFPCARSALDSWPKQGSEIPTAYGNATGDKGLTEQEKLDSEIATDNDLRTQDKRNKIYEQFKAWGRSKGWRDQYDNIICP